MDDEELVGAIAHRLEIDHQYIEHVPENQPDRVARVRRCGREAGRRLGWTVRTFQTDPSERDDRHVLAHVVVMVSTPEDDERLRERGKLLVREAMKNWPA